MGDGGLGRGGGSRQLDLDGWTREAGGAAGGCGFGEPAPQVSGAGGEDGGQIVRGVDADADRVPAQIEARADEPAVGERHDDAGGGGAGGRAPGGRVGSRSGLQMLRPGELRPARVQREGGERHSWELRLGRRSNAGGSRVEWR